MRPGRNFIADTRTVVKTFTVTLGLKRASLLFCLLLEFSSGIHWAKCDGLRDRESETFHWSYNKLSM